MTLEEYHREAELKSLVLPAKLYHNQVAVVDACSVEARAVTAGDSA